VESAYDYNSYSNKQQKPTKKKNVGQGPLLIEYILSGKIDDAAGNKSDIEVLIYL
jgi:hypothetical protein